MDIHTRQLRYFLELARCLNFTKAATNLYIAQPALSQQIAELEKQLGATLFVRNSRSVELTAAGKILQSACPEILLKLESVQQQILCAQAGLRGSLKIGYLYVFQPLLPAIIQEFRRLYPDIALEFYNGNLKELQMALENRDIDIAFSWINCQEIPEGSLASYNILWKENLCLVAHKDHPFVTTGCQDFSMLESENFILIDDSATPGYQFMARKASSVAGFFIKHRTCAKDFPSILVQIQAGIGVSILPGNTQDFPLNSSSNLVFTTISRKCMDFGAIWFSDSANPVLPLFLDLLDNSADQVFKVHP